MTETLAPPVTTSLTGLGGVLVVSCYEMGHQPLNLASPLAHLLAAGFQPSAVDTSVEPLEPGVISAAGLVAISVPMHTALRLGAQVAARIRVVNPRAHICFFGLYATLNADYLLESLGDSVIGGEYEVALCDLARALDARVPPSNAPGVGVSRRPAAPVLERFPAHGPVRLNLPELRRYAGLERDGVVISAGYIEATRGCHHTCGHCPITPVYGGRFFAIPRSIVIADALAQIDEGARHLTFGDPDFFNGPQHGLRIMRAIRETAPSVTFDATIKIEHLLEHRRLLPELAELGCAFVVSAVETLSPRVLRRLSKGHDRAGVDQALRLLDDVGIPMRPSLLPFTPWSTLADQVELVQWIARQDLIDHVDPVHFSIRLLVPPGSALLDHPDRETWVGELDQANFSYRWVHDDARVDLLQREIAITVEQAARCTEEPRTTFRSIWRLVHGAAGAEDERIPEPIIRRPKPPRLTESWFC